MKVVKAFLKSNTVFNTFLVVQLPSLQSPEAFCIKGVLRNVAKLTGKHPCQSPFFTKVTG